MTHLGPKKYTIIDAYYQVILADGFKRASFLSHDIHKNLELIFFFSVRRLYYQGWQGGKILSLEGEIIKSYPVIMKK